MRPHTVSKSHSKSTSAAQYKECVVCERGVASSNVAMEENPAYQSVDVAAAGEFTNWSRLQSLEPNHPPILF